MRKLYWLHRIVGVSIGSVLALLSLAGSLLVFLPDVIDPWLNADILSVQPGAVRIPVQEALDQAVKAYPSLRPVDIVFPRHANGTYEVWMMVQEPEPVGKSRLVYVDPYRGTLLGTRVDGSSLRWWLYYLHVFLFDLSGSGGIGATSVGLAGIALVGLLLTGTGIWNGTRRFLRSGRRLGPVEVHRLVGIGSGLCLLVIGLTGALLSFPDAIATIAAEPSSAPSPAGASPRPLTNTDQPLPVDLLLEQAELALPGGTVTSMSLGAIGDPVVIRKALAADPESSLGNSRVSVDPFTGDVVAIHTLKSAPWGKTVTSWFYPLHTGEAGGLPMRILWLCAGLAPCTLFVTGCLMTWRRRRAGL